LPRPHAGDDGKPGGETRNALAAGGRAADDDHSPGASVPAAALCTPLPRTFEVPRAARSPAGDSLGAVRAAVGALVAWIHALRLEKSGAS
jgi:hypothetical protein